MSGEVFVLFFFGFAFATFWLSLYTYALFAFGKRLANRFRTRLGPLPAAACFGVMAAIVDLPFLAVEALPIYKLTLLLAVWLIHAQPASVGYWSTCEVQRLQDEQRWAAAAETWVSEFEEPVAQCMKDFDVNEGT